MAQPAVMELAVAERSDLATLLGELSAADWETASLRAGWTVRDVVAHMYSYEELGLAGLLGRMVRGRFSSVRMNDLGVRALADQSPDQLVDFVTHHGQPRGLAAWGGGRVALTDGLIHQQDIRRPLGRPRSIPAERLVAALDTAMTAPTLPARRLTRGLRLVATDLDWSRGEGPEVTGSGEALLMAAAGRTAALGELAGPGLATLTERSVR